MLPWITALKVFNKGSPSWCIPRKGTVGYETILKIRQGQDVKTPKQIMDELERKTVGKPKTEKRSMTVSLTQPEMEKPKPKPKRIRAKIPISPKEQRAEIPMSEPPKKETLEEKAKREARDKYEREHREGGITIPKTADEPMKEMGQGKYPTAPLFTEAQLADLNRFAKDYRRFGLKVNESRKHPIRNAQYLHKVGTDTVTFFWAVEGKNIYDERTKSFTEHDDQFYYVKTYTFGKPLPDDPTIEHPGEEKKKEPATEPKKKGVSLADKIKKVEDELADLTKTWKTETMPEHLKVRDAVAQRLFKKTYADLSASGKDQVSKAFEKEHPDLVKEAKTYHKTKASLENEKRKLTEELKKRQEK